MYQLKIFLTPSITSARSVALEIKQFALPNLAVYTFPVLASSTTFLGIVSRAAIVWGIFLSLEDFPPYSIERLHVYQLIVSCELGNLARNHLDQMVRY